jgi:hypothetical protein
MESFNKANELFIEEEYDGAIEVRQLLCDLQVVVDFPVILTFFPISIQPTVVYEGTARTTGPGVSAVMQGCCLHQAEEVHTSVARLQPCDTIDSHN